MRALFVCRGDIIAAAALKGWLDAGHEVAEIWHGPHSLSRSQRTVGWFAPDWSVYQLALRHRIAMLANPPLRDWQGAADRISDIRADVLIVAVTMQIIPERMIELFAGRAVNFHPALLPHYRGPSPFLGQILDGRENEYGGMTLHQLTAGIDQGPIIAQIPVTYDSAGRDYEAWRVAVASAGRQLSRKALPAFLENRVGKKLQGQGSYRRLTENQIAAATTFAEAKRIMGLAGSTGHIRATGHPVRRLVGRIGAPTGVPASLGPFHITLDIADARIRLARWNELDSMRQRLDQLRAIRSVERLPQL